MLVTILPFIGVLIGAFLQFTFTRYLEAQRHHRDLRTQAYLDYLKSVSGLAHLNEPNGSQERDLLTGAADAKARICLYGSAEVIRAFAQFERLGAMLSTPSEQQAFVAMIASMRKDSGNRSQVDSQNIWLLLLGDRRMTQGDISKLFEEQR
jgi:hypothetical protein